MYDLLKRSIEGLGYTWFSAPMQLNIIGVRSATGAPNKFDDDIFVAYKNLVGDYCVYRWEYTTDPGLYHLQHPSKVEGTAILVPGQYDSYMLGKHRGRYQALVQRRGEVRVYRDGNKDDILDYSGEEDNGYFGINIHKAGKHSIQVDKWSAGCQVFANEADYDTFIAICESAARARKNEFVYTLIEQMDIEQRVYTS